MKTLFKALVASIAVTIPACAVTGELFVPTMDGGKAVIGVEYTK